ncbi:MAG: glycosyltransferase family 4 protein [Alphaproteobacteria bacterium]|nr:glycosyltransferase family 4 protein [Alphaproteobacteria bacterium]MBV9373106.1 glycosyltransferase family 4 protein [Alphaproteobacteria bacterium]MBV9902864.1 glycosyltransferase family 4 protein [Alphaproteobacteria bacterium]
MQPKTIVISINASWNILNFRLGLIRALQAAGHRVVALAPRDAYSERLEALGIEYRAIAMDKQGLSPARDLALLLRYVRALRAIRPDVFLGYTAKPNVYGSLAARMLGIAVVSNVSGLGTAFIRGGLLSRIVSSLYRLAFRGASTVFFQNGEDRDLFVAQRIVPAEKARLLPGSGVDTARFAPAPLPAAEGRPFTFLLVGRLLWDKGVGEYVEAARRVRARAPGTRFRLLGFLDVENRTAVPRREVEAWAAEGLIDYLGHADDVRPAIAEADCVVLPSYREGLPRTLIEAAAMARPLIATDVPGCRHAVEAGVNGLLCAVRDAGALADAMLEMIAAGPERRAAWGAAGRARVEAEFDERRVAALYLEAIARA